MRYFVSGISAFLALLLFPSAFWICELAYPSMDDIENWRLLRDLFWGVQIFLLIISCTFRKNKLTIASMYALGILVFGDMVDRIIFGVHEFNWVDWLCIIVSAFVFALKIKDENVSAG